MRDWNKRHTSSDSETSEKVVDDGPDGSLELQWHPKGLNTAIDGNSHDEKNVQPVDMLVPVLASQRRIGDMDLLRVGSLRARVCLGRHGGRYLYHNRERGKDNGLKAKKRRREEKKSRRVKKSGGERILWWG